MALANKPQPIFPWATEWRNCSFWRIFGSSKLFKQKPDKFPQPKKGERTLVVSKPEEVLWIRFFSSWKSQLTVKKSWPSWKMAFFDYCLFCHVWNIPTCGEFDHSSPAFQLYLPKKGHDSSLSWDSHCHELFFNRNRISKTVTFLKLADLLGQVNLDPVVLILSRCKEDTIPRLEFLQCLSNHWMRWRCS